ncbi:MAG: NusG domain II-containing protein [Oscillospiraceae bacterium]|nr:NusG domain II-containing protein [Oscillospiraceae bacterium]
MKKKDLIVILAVLLLAVILLVYGLSMRTTQQNPEKPVETAQPFPSAEGSSEGEAEMNASPSYSEKTRAAAEAYLREYPAESYLILTTNGGISSPIPLNEENSFRVRQGDGSENVVHIGKNSFYMESSNCDNQNCVGEGEVTLENRDSRILYNMVICLPHQLTLELLTPEETEERLLQLYAAQEAYQAEVEAYLAEHPEEAAAAGAQAEGEHENE